MAIPMPKSRPRADPTLGLINIVFLIVMFYLVAGTLSGLQRDEVDPAKMTTGEGTVRQGDLAINAAGVLLLDGDEVDAEAAWTRLAPDARINLRLLADREAPADQLIDVATRFRALGAEQIILLAEKAARQ